MAHPQGVKARAIVLLMVGNTVGYVARECNVPKQTISRWKVDARQLLHECVKTHPRYDELVEVGRMLRRSIQNGTKKGNFPTR